MNKTSIQLISRLESSRDKTIKDVLTPNVQSSVQSSVQSKYQPKCIPSTARYVERSIQETVVKGHSHNHGSKTGTTETKTNVGLIIPSIDVVLNSINLIDRIQPTLPEDLKIYFFSDESRDKTATDEKATITTVISQDSCTGINYGKYFEDYVRNSRIKKFSKLINISKSAEKLRNIFLTGRGMIPQLYEQEYDVANNYDVTKKYMIDSIVSISKEKFMNLCLETYLDDDAILKQFIVDYPREDVFLNGKRIKTIDELFIDLSRSNRMIQLEPATRNKRNQISTMIFALLLMCQSSFYVSFLHLHNKVNKMKMTLEQDPSLKNDKKYNIHVTDLKERNQIHLYVSENTFSCSFEAKYKIIDISEDRTLYKVDTETLFDLNSDLCLVVYEAEI